MLVDINQSGCILGAGNGGGGADEGVSPTQTAWPESVEYNGKEEEGNGCWG